MFTESTPDGDPATSLMLMSSVPGTTLETALPPICVRFSATALWLLAMTTGSEPAIGSCPSVSGEPLIAVMFAEVTTVETEPVMLTVCTGSDCDVKRATTNMAAPLLFWTWMTFD